MIYAAEITCAVCGGSSKVEIDPEGLAFFNRMARARFRCGSCEAEAREEEQRTIVEERKLKWIDRAPARYLDTNVLRLPNQTAYRRPPPGRTDVRG